MKTTILTTIVAGLLSTVAMADTSAVQAANDRLNEAYDAFEQVDNGYTHRVGLSTYGDSAISVANYQEEIAALDAVIAAKVASNGDRTSSDWADYQSLKADFKADFYGIRPAAKVLVDGDAVTLRGLKSMLESDLVFEMEELAAYNEVVAAEAAVANANAAPIFTNAPVEVMGLAADYLAGDYSREDLNDNYPEYSFWWNQL